ncbi:hypothetical protein TI10_17635 [Photorhabdus luminescens subsp. luminescens]|uniref:hypothetical protein n=1 Tax=Photorhabdus TaxID=29487 RepID=UPI00066AEC57|nr:hypothetical protein [Photorhabdus luminescens]KMW71935.1 hypothetical protein TI10_17635 [Photorhabdus luminescens subsp. luminescens]
MELAKSAVPSSRKINGKALSGDVSLNAGDVGAYNKEEANQRFQPLGNYMPAGNYAVRGECYTRGESDSRYLKSGSGNRVRVWSGGPITNGTVRLSHNVLGKTLYCYDPNQNWYYTVIIPAPNIDIFALSGTGWIAIRLNSTGTTLTISKTGVFTSAIDIYE